MGGHHVFYVWVTTHEHARATGRLLLLSSSSSSSSLRMGSITFSSSISFFFSLSVIPFLLDQHRPGFWKEIAGCGAVRRQSGIDFSGGLTRGSGGRVRRIFFLVLHCFRIGASAVGEPCLLGLCRFSSTSFQYGRAWGPSDCCIEDTVSSFFFFLCHSRIPHCCRLLGLSGQEGSGS